MWTKLYKLILFCVLFLKVKSDDLSEDLKKLIEEKSLEIANRIKIDQTNKINSITATKVTGIMTGRLAKEREDFNQERDAAKVNLTKTFENLLHETKDGLLKRIEMDISKNRNETMSKIQNVELNIRNYAETKQQSAQDYANDIAEQTKQSFDQRLEKVYQNISSQSSNQVSLQPVAFTVILTKNVAKNNGNYVKFDRVVSNFGLSYNSTSGIFTAPNDGVFMFSLSFLVKDGYVNVQLMKNGSEVGRGYAAEDEYEGAGFISMIFSLSKGDQVAIKMIPGWSTGHIRGDLYSSFSGFLLGNN